MTVVPTNALRGPIEPTSSRRFLAQGLSPALICNRVLLTARPLELATGAQRKEHRA